MADISLIEEDIFLDSVFKEEDDILSPLGTFQKYALSKHEIDRQKVPLVLMSIFKNRSYDLSRYIPDMMRELSRLVFDDEFETRLSILEEVSDLAVVTRECLKHAPELFNVFTDFLLPLIVQSLGDKDKSVARIAESQLFVLIDKCLLTRLHAESFVCPRILNLSSMECLEDHIDTIITVMSRIAPFVGGEIIESHFLKTYCEFFKSDSLYVRCVCISYIGVFCAVVGKKVFEDFLLPCYLSSCVDREECIREACARTIVAVSCACPPVKRYKLLAPAFSTLLNDKKESVRRSAFINLGQFISTFAKPRIGTLAFNCSRELIVYYKNGTERSLRPYFFGEVRKPGKLQQDSIDDVNSFGDEQDADLEIKVGNVALELLATKHTQEPFTEAVQDNNLLETFNDNDFIQSALTQDLTSSETNKKNCTDIFMNMINTNESYVETHIGAELVNGYGHTSLKKSSDTTEIDKLNSNFDNSIKDITKIENLNTGGGMGSDDLIKNECRKEYNVAKENIKIIEHEDAYNSFNFWYISPYMPLDDAIINLSLPMKIQEERCIDHCSRWPLPCLDKCKDIKTCSKIDKENLCVEQNIVPQVLIDHFNSMTDPDLADECAYSLPIVVLTIGRDNWHLVKHTVEILARDKQYEVRRTVASSLHELAILIGFELASSDLIPLLDGFVKDLCGVRLSVLKHLGEFLKVLKGPQRNLCLLMFKDFMPVDYMSSLNWRYRKELADSFVDVVSLFMPLSISKYINPIALKLLCDKVADVREAALLLMVKIFQQLAPTNKLKSDLLVELAEKFAHSTQWKKRQLFCKLCAKLVTSLAIDFSTFECDGMPHLLDLSWDPVPNVRLVAARTISQNIAANKYFYDIHSQHYDSIHSILRRLQSDKDPDVRHFALTGKPLAVPLVLR